MAKYTIGRGVLKGKCFFSERLKLLAGKHVKEGAGGHDELFGEDDHTELAKSPKRLWSMVIGRSHLKDFC